MLSCVLFAFLAVVRILRWWGGVLVVGTLKGYDQLMNLVLDDVKELLRGNT
jgi:small nuclear ribonucleoprotein (snRNP)-like protein